MEKWNETELIRHMDRLGCFHAANAESETCKKLLALLLPNNGSNSDHNVVRNESDDYSVLNRVAIACYSLAIFLNCVLLWTMVKDPLKRLRTPSSLLIANLAISDMLGAGFSLAIEKELSEANNSRPIDWTTLYLPWLVVTTAQCSYHTVFLVSFDRYAAIVYPFRYRSLVITKYTLLIILISWLLAFTISSPLFFSHQLYKKITTGNEIYAINTFILIAIILVLYPLTHRKLRRQRKQLLTMNANNQKLRTQKLKVEKNFANTMFMVCFSLILFASPYVVVFFFTTTNCTSCILNNYFLNIWMYFRIVFATHFGVNPVIYAWRLPCYRKSLLILLRTPFKNGHVSRCNRSTATTITEKSGTGARENYGVRSTMADTRT